MFMTSVPNFSTSAVFVATATKGFEVAGGLGEVRTVHVGDEPEGQITSAVVPQRLVRHDRAEIGATDTDVDDVPDRRAGVAAPLADAHPSRELTHPVEHLVHRGHHIDTVDGDALAPRFP